MVDGFKGLERLRLGMNEKGRVEKLAIQHREKARVQPKETSTCSTLYL
jgi:hypothetical protein